MSNEGRSGSIDSPIPSFELKINADLQGFEAVEVTSVDESLPYKPPLEVAVTLADGTVAEVAASTPYAVFVDKDGGRLEVSIASAGHVKELHVDGKDAGSVFDVSTIDELLVIVQEHLPEGIAESDGVSAFSVETSRPMGEEGVGGLDVLLSAGLVSSEEVEEIAANTEVIIKLNLEGSDEDKNRFVAEYNAQHEGSKIKLQQVRSGVIVLAADVPKQPTTELFMVFGPTGEENTKTMYTMAPGRFMPKMPNPSEHTVDGAVDENTFKESTDAWLSTAMLVG